VLKQYVQSGGNLIAFQPGKNLSPLFGLRSLGDTINEGYVKLNADNKTANGLTTETMQFHGTADKYKAHAANVIAHFYKNSTAKTRYPAVSHKKSGNGNAIAFSYNLPRSILLTRQGNFKNAGLEKDGIKGLRAMDLFTDGWVDTTKNMLNQADEQMRLLTHCIEFVINTPLPRFWYFPDTLKTLVTLTNDGEYSDEKDIVPQFADIVSKNANMSLYILTANKISKAVTDELQKTGNEISGHPDNTQNAEHPTWQNMDSSISEKLKEIAVKYGVPSMRTIVNHWFVWNGKDAKGIQDFTAQARIEKMHGIEMDINYAHYDNNSPQGHFLGPMGLKQGNYTGSGLPMKFGTLDGNTIGIYQHVNNVYDQQYMEHADSVGFYECFKGLMDRSLNDEVYSYISVKSHNDEYHFSKQPLAKMLDYALSKNVPVWTPVKLLDFLKARDQALFQNIEYSGNRLSFMIQSDLVHPGSFAVMIPYSFKGKIIQSITNNAKTQSFIRRKIKGTEYGMFSVKPGTAYQIGVTYAE
jgi:hypothetical protein